MVGADCTQPAVAGHKIIRLTGNGRGQDTIVLGVRRDPRDVDHQLRHDRGGTQESEYPRTLGRRDAEAPTRITPCLGKFRQEGLRDDELKGSLPPRIDEPCRDASFRGEPCHQNIGIEDSDDHAERTDA